MNPELGARLEERIQEKLAARQATREVFEREMEDALRYAEMALRARSSEEIRTLLRLAGNRLKDASRVAVPEVREEANG